MRHLSSSLTTLLTVAALFALTGWQVTGETASTRLLGRLGAAIVEIDRWLPAHQEDLQLLARDRGEGVIVVRDLPIEVTLPASTVAAADGLALKSMLRREMGRQLYENGNGAFRDNDGDRATLSVTEPVRWTVTLLGKGMHGFWLAVMVLTLLLLLAASASVMTTGQTPVHAIATGAVIGAVGALAFWLLMQVASSMVSGPADREIVQILKDGAWMGVRNCGGVAFASGVIAFLLSIGHGHGQGAGSRYAPAPSRPGSPFP